MSIIQKYTMSKYCKPKSFDYFMQKARKQHKEKYSYHSDSYSGMSKKAKITCKLHGDFLQIPSDHIRGRGCPKCFHNSKSYSDFVKTASRIHNNKYEYNENTYVKMAIKSIITCPLHGNFWQKPSKHISGQGCPKCRDESFVSTTFIDKAKILHKNLYDYSKVEYKNNCTKVCITCPKHGDFWQEPRKHLQQRGCPNCNDSKGEMAIEQFLKNNNIQYEKQKTFEKCKYINQLYYDFYLPEHNIAIEYDGIQHYKAIKYYGGEEKLIITKLRDNVKTNYCKKNNIKLIRIPYNKFNKINEILGKI